MYLQGILCDEHHHTARSSLRMRLGAFSQFECHADGSRTSVSEFACRVNSGHSTAIHSIRVLSHPKNKGEWNLNQGFHSKMSFLLKNNNNNNTAAFYKEKFYGLTKQISGENYKIYTF